MRLRNWGKGKVNQALQQFPSKYKSGYFSDIDLILLLPYTATQNCCNYICENLLPQK